MERYKFKNLINKLFTHIHDERDIEFVLTALADTCYDIAQHVATNWQDEDLAELWETRGQILHNVDLSD